MSRGAQAEYPNVHCSTFVDGYDLAWELVILRDVRPFLCLIFAPLFVDFDSGRLDVGHSHQGVHILGGGEILGPSVAGTVHHQSEAYCRQRLAHLKDWAQDLKTDGCGWRNIHHKHVVAGRRIRTPAGACGMLQRRADGVYFLIPRKTVPYKSLFYICS